MKEHGPALSPTTTVILSATPILLALGARQRKRRSHSKKIMPTTTSTWATQSI
jgi:hypothetical protein